jgi:hypothetical protein
MSTLLPHGLLPIGSWSQHGQSPQRHGLTEPKQLSLGTHIHMSTAGSVTGLGVGGQKGRAWPWAAENWT